METLILRYPTYKMFENLIFLVAEARLEVVIDNTGLHRKKH